MHAYYAIMHTYNMYLKCDFSKASLEPLNLNLHLESLIPANSIHARITTSSLHNLRFVLH